MTTPIVKIRLDGHVDDLYALSLLFPEGACPNLHIVTQIIGTKDGLFDRIHNADRRDTYVTGDGCLSIIETRKPREAGWVAMEIIAPLNGYAVLADSNFNPVTPVAATWDGEGFSGGAVFGSTIPNKPTRLITTNRHELLQQLLPSRIAFMSENPLAAYAAAVIAGPPSWAEYYRLLEDISGHVAPRSISWPRRAWRNGRRSMVSRWQPTTAPSAATARRSATQVFPKRLS